jgi:hypothetical protein
MKSYQLIAGNVWQSVRDDFGPVPGTYRLQLWNEALTSFCPITRLLGIDHQGTLYIGTSGNLPNRIGTLRKAISAAYHLPPPEGYRDPTVHGAGRMISKLFTDTFAVGRLFVEVHPYPPVEGDSFNYYAEEWRLLSAYAECFGEFPPLNGLKPSRTAKDLSVLPKGK